GSFIENGEDHGHRGMLHRRAAYSGEVLLMLNIVSADREYTARLEKQTGKGWKRLLGVQAPYRRHIRKVVEGRVLDVGCGIGRNLQHLDGNGVGVDLNPHSIEVARSHGLTAYTSDEFAAGPDATMGGYDSLLFAHVLEHMTPEEASSLLGVYLPYLGNGGRVIVIVPQEAGFRSDPTHVTFLDLDDLMQIEGDHDLVREAGYSFPLPRSAGRVFTHNETVALSRKAPSAPL
ncbi:MAG: class I SAM-dependent methyltransferase, partial [Acidimicrobiia bacterium]